MNTKTVMKASKCESVMQIDTQNNINIILNEYKSEIKTAVIIKEKTGIYHNPNMLGFFEFDYSNNNKKFMIGLDEFKFTTRWSACGNDSVYAYNDDRSIDSIGLVDHEIKFNENICLNTDMSSRTRVVKIGESIIWINKYHNIAITKVLEVEYRGRNSNRDWLKCEYRIYD